jgi:hypothetical protein
MGGRGGKVVILKLTCGSISDMRPILNLVVCTFLQISGPMIDWSPEAGDDSRFSSRIQLVYTKQQVSNLP